MKSKPNELSFLRNALKILVARIVEAQRTGDEEHMLDLIERKKKLIKRLAAHESEAA